MLAATEAAWAPLAGVPHLPRVLPLGRRVGGRCMPLSSKERRAVLCCPRDQAHATGELVLIMLKKIIDRG